MPDKRFQQYPIYTQEDRGYANERGVGVYDANDAEARRLVEMYMRAPSRLSPAEDASREIKDGTADFVPYLMGVALANPDYDYTPNHFAHDSLFMASRIPGAYQPRYFVEDLEGQGVSSEEKALSNREAHKTFKTAAQAMERDYPGISGEFIRAAAKYGYEGVRPEVDYYQTTAQRVAEAMEGLNYFEPGTPEHRRAMLETISGELAAHEAGHKSGLREFYGNRPGYAGPTHLGNALKGMEAYYSMYPKGPEYRILTKEVQRLQDTYPQPQGATEYLTRADLP